MITWGPQQRYGLSMEQSVTPNSTWRVDSEAVNANGFRDPLRSWVLRVPRHASALSGGESISQHYELLKN
jgi:hypothetical protein